MNENYWNQGAGGSILDFGKISIPPLLIGNQSCI